MDQTAETRESEGVQIRVSARNRDRLLAVAGRLQAATSRRYTLDEALGALLDGDDEERAMVYQR